MVAFTSISGRTLFLGAAMNTDLRFLVVEDHGFQRWIVANQLEGLGARYVFQVPDGQAALDLLADCEPPIDIAVTDLDMPGMDGMEFIRHVGKMGRSISLILASGLAPSLIATVESMTRAYGLNLLGAIQKPVTAAKLEAAISRYESAANTKTPTAEPSFTAEEIAEALKRGEFEPFFQPKVDTRTRMVVGAEAMARWRHPQKGIIRPSAFIDRMEASGLIEDLTTAILEAAVFECSRWRKAGIDAGVSVNLSLENLDDTTLADQVMNLVDAHGLETQHLTFEITESASTRGRGSVLENLSRLGMKGFGLSIDDYGTGYSSMKRLSGVPFTELKIDQGFVKQASTQKSSRAMLESSLELARKLGIPAVAEGVESRIEWDLVRSLGCPLAQGYYLARPMAASEFQSWAHIGTQRSA